jgi:hypothetical protein
VSHGRLIDTDISTPCSIWDQYKRSRTSWGINVLGSFLVEIEASDGTVGFATGFGGQLFTHPPSTLHPPLSSPSPTPLLFGIALIVTPKGWV